MRSPVRRLLLIAVIASLWMLLAVLGLRSLGMTDQFQALDHPLIKEDFWLIAWGGDEKAGDLMTHKAFRAAAALDDRVILGAAVQSLKDGTLVLSEEHYLFDGTETTFLRRLDFDQWKERVPEGITLKDFVETYSGRRLYLSIERLNILNQAQLTETLQPLAEKKQILIQSSPQGIKKSLKEKQPWWLFSNTTSEIGKLKIMYALYLEPIASLNADFFVDKSFEPRLVAELHRRFKKAVFAPKESESDILVKARSYDGLVTSQPSDFISLVD